MRVNIIAFALGVWLLQQQAQLPSLLHLTLICITAAAFFGLKKWLKTRASRAFSAIACLLIGFAWAAAFGHARLADRLDRQLQGRDLVVSGVIASLPQPLERGVRFNFAVEDAPAGVPSMLALCWFIGLCAD